VRVYQLVLALKAPNLGIIVCVDLAVRRSLYIHETIGRSVWDWLHNGDVHEDSPISSMLSLLLRNFVLHWVAVSHSYPFSGFQCSEFPWEVFTKGDTWGVPGLNSKTLIILQNSD
jgi:hypothetical protein